MQVAAKDKQEDAQNQAAKASAVNSNDNWIPAPIRLPNRRSRKQSLTEDSSKTLASCAAVGPDARKRYKCSFHSQEQPFECNECSLKLASYGQLTSKPIALTVATTHDVTRTWNQGLGTGYSVQS